MPLTVEPPAPDRNLALELVRVTEAAAMAAGRWVGRGDKNGADDVAVQAMRVMISTIGMNGTVVIGEGEKDNAPMLYNGESVGDGTGPEVVGGLDVALPDAAPVRVTGRRPDAARQAVVEGLDVGEMGFEVPPIVGALVRLEADLIERGVFNPSRKLQKPRPPHQRHRQRPAHRPARTRGREQVSARHRRGDRGTAPRQ